MTTIVCKKCNSDKVSKNGIVRLEQPIPGIIWDE